MALAKVPLSNGGFRKLTEVSVSERKKPLIFQPKILRLTFKKICTCFEGVKFRHLFSKSVINFLTVNGCTVKDLFNRNEFFFSASRHYRHH